MAVEQFANNATTKLDGGINDSTTTIVVVEFSTFPTSAQFRIKIDNEIMLVTGGAGTDTWTVERGAEDTVARVHADGAFVKHILTSGSLNQFMQDHVAFGLTANLPAQGQSNRLYIPTDGNCMFFDDGSVWRKQIGSSLFDLNQNYASFSWYNQGSATVTLRNDGLRMQSPASGNGSGDSARIYARAVPATPYTFTTAYVASFMPQNYMNGGLCYYDTGTGRYINFGLAYAASPVIDVSYWNSVNSFASEGIRRSNMFGMRIWLKLEDNGTTRYYHYSLNGIDWVTLLSESNSTWITPTHVGYVFNCLNGNDTQSQHFFGYEIG
jgi:hypothetical protein